MLNFRKNLKKSLTIKTHSNLRDKIFLNPYNQWILSEKIISRAFFELFAKLQPHHHQMIIQQGEIILQPVSGEFSCIVQTPQDSAVILLFPELIKALSSVDNSRGLAILAHEFGHIYYAHHKKNISTLEAQIEADSIAFEAGLGHGLIDVLLKYHDIDSQTRVSILTAKILSQQN